MNIGFIGLGGMGRPMVEHLLAAGWGAQDTSCLLSVLERGGPPP